MKNWKHINTFDIDGVIFVNEDIGGVYPGVNDVIITGRSAEEKAETERMLLKRKIRNKVYFNPLPFDQKTRRSSGEHKAAVLNRLLAEGYVIGCHFEDDEIQIAAINELCPQVPVIHLVHTLTNKENIRHPVTGEMLQRLV